MKTLKEIDTLIAEKVMGWKRLTHAQALQQAPDPNDEQDNWMNGLTNEWYDGENSHMAYVDDEGLCRDEYESGFQPSIDIGDAWVVVEKKMDDPMLWRDGYWNCRCLRPNGQIAEVFDALAAPLAICLAALKAHGIDVEA